MADTGSNGMTGFDPVDADLEMATLIADVVNKRAPQPESRAKPMQSDDPRFRPGMAVTPLGEGLPETDSARAEINSLMDDIKRDVDARSAQDVSKPNAKPQAWLADAVVAQQTMQGHEDRRKEARFDMPERAPRKKVFRSNPFVAKAATAAVPVAIGAAAARGAKRAENTPDLATSETEIAGDAFARDLVAGAERPEEVGKTASPTEIDSTSEVKESRFRSLAEVDDFDFNTARTEDLPPAEESRSDSRSAYATVDDDTEFEWEEGAASPGEDTPEVAPVSIAAMDAQTHSDDPSGPPIWLAMGIPVAAVSMAALVAGVNMVRDSAPEDGTAEASTLASVTVTYADEAAAQVPPVVETAAVEALAVEAPSADAVATDVLAAASPSDLPTNTQDAVEEIALANAPAAVIEPDSMIADPVEAVVDANLAADGATPSTPEIIEVIAPVVSTSPEPAIETSPAVEAGLDANGAVPTLPSFKPAAPQRVVATASPELPSTRTISTPSLKPQQASVSVLRASVPSKSATPAVFQPRRGQVPVRVFDGHLERGSAALLVNEIAASMGAPLSKTEQSWLARDVERALDNEVDGRDVSLKSAQGERIGILFAESGQALRHLTVARDRGVAPLPAQMMLEGGWYVAREETQLRATPSLAGTFSNRNISKGALIERMATVVDRYGDRWYLMGRDGVAVGYMSPADLVIAGAAQQPIGLPYDRRHREVVREQVPVFTRCRTIFAGPLGSTRQKVDVCRNANGNWIAASEGLAPLQQAQVTQAAPIILASAEHVNPDLAPFEVSSVRKALAPKLVYAREGQTIKQTLADGRDVAMTLGAKYEAVRTVPVMRLEALGRIDAPMQLDARWMRVPGGASLRATPDHFTPLDTEPLPAGLAIEMIGTVAGEHGNDWALVGRNGVGFGYVLRHELMPLAGSTAVRAASSQHTAAVVDLVAVATDCRSVDYSGVALDGTFTACQQPDGRWSLSSEPALRQLVDLEPSSRVAP